MQDEIWLVYPSGIVSKEQAQDQCQERYPQQKGIVKRIDECQEGYPSRNQRLLNLKTKARGQSKESNGHDLGNSYDTKRSVKCKFPGYATKEEGYPQQKGIIPSK